MDWPTGDRYAEEFYPVTLPHYDNVDENNGQTTKDNVNSRYSAREEYYADARGGASYIVARAWGTGGSGGGTLRAYYCDSDWVWHLAGSWAIGYDSDYDTYSSATPIQSPAGLKITWTLQSGTATVHVDELWTANWNY